MMAKRKRLTPAQPGPYSDLADASAGPLETKSFLLNPPIAQVAGEASATAALAEVTQRLGDIRSSGRLIEPIALDAIEENHLVRDRIFADEEELSVLIESLRRRGQQTPIEVVVLDGGTFGLISGWRRVTALKRLHAETGDDRFGTVLAIRRSPDAASDAYVAMVEENEIRVGLSYFERARIVDRSVAQGIFPSDKTALQTLFASASRAKRSKIGSFLPVVRELEQVLQFPTQIPERLGLQLSKALDDPAFSRDLANCLRQASEARAEGQTTAESEQKLLQSVLAEMQSNRRPRRPEPAPSIAPAPVSEIRKMTMSSLPSRLHPAAMRRPQGIPMPPVMPEPRHQIVPGIFLFEGHHGLELRGDRVTAALKADLIAWLREQN